MGARELEELGIVEIPAGGGRVPPHSEEAEQGVLGALLLDPSRIIDAQEMIQPEDFFSKRNGTLYSALLQLSDVGAPVDMVNVMERLMAQQRLDAAGGRTYILQLTNLAASPAHLQHHLKIVRESALLRRLIGTANGIIESAYSTRPIDDHVERLLDQSETEIYAVADASDTGGPVPISVAVEEAFKRLESSQQNEILGVPTGYYELDEMTGGFSGGQLIILAARPAMGKTALALNLMMNAATSTSKGSNGRKPRVLFYSLEMGREDIVARFLCMRSRVHMHKLRKRNLSDRDFAELTKAAGELRELHIIVDDTPGLPVAAIRSRARRVKQREGLDMIVVDYLQLMSHPRAESRQMEISHISRCLKELSRELDVPVIALSQLSRAVESREGKRPQLSDLRESGSIEQDADVVMMLYRPEYYEAEPTEENRNRAQLILAKQRNGPTGTVNLMFFNQTMRFENPAPSIAEPVAPHVT
jgi:replicative DNA helicase